MANAIVHLAEFKQQEALIKQFGEGNAHLIWVMSMYLDEPDAKVLGVDCLTDQPNDKKLDFIFLDSEDRRLVFAQGYYSEKNGGSAPANKASDLNTAAAWLISGDLDKVPEALADTIRSCRSSLEAGEVDSIELLYVHNLSESKNVREELETARSHLEKGLGKAEIQIATKEIGIEECERLFVAKESGILVKDEILIPSDIKFEESGKTWKAAIVSLPASWLYDQFQKFGQPLFSANYRGFLGVSKRRKINAAIKQTAEGTPDDFWVYNNGITLLTLDYEGKKDKTTKITGCSVINGAQTTGSLSQIDPKKHDLSKVKVLARLVACKDSETVRNIVRYNNTQNEITTWDQYSNTETQKRLADEFSALGHFYSLKRGFGQSITGLGIEVVAQPLLAFLGAIDDANRGKNTVFERKTAYNRAFDGVSARHILFVFSLAQAIDKIRVDLKTANASGTLIKAQEKQLRLARHVRFKYFFMAVVAGCLEASLKRKVDRQTIGFSTVSSNAKTYTLEQLALRWQPLVASLFALMASQVSEDPAEAFSDPTRIDSIVGTLEGLILAANLADQADFKAFAGLL